MSKINWHHSFASRLFTGCFLARLLSAEEWAQLLIGAQSHSFTLTGFKAMKDGNGDFRFASKPGNCPASAI